MTSLVTLSHIPTQSPQDAPTAPDDLTPAPDLETSAARQESVTACKVCGCPLARMRRRHARHCSARCRMVACRARRVAAVSDPPGFREPTNSVVESP